MMLGEESASATYWKKCGDAALANGVQHVVIMVSGLALHFLLYHLPLKISLMLYRGHTGLL